MRKIIGVVALVAGFVLVASPPVHAAGDDLAAQANVRQGATNIPSGGSVNFGTTPLGTPVTIDFIFENVSASACTGGNYGTPTPNGNNVGGCQQAQEIRNAVATAPAGFSISDDITANSGGSFDGIGIPGGATTTFQVRCDAAVAGTHSGQVTITYNIRDFYSDATTLRASPFLNTSGPTYSFTVSCQVDAPTAATPASVAPASVAPASVAPATKKKPTIPKVGSSPVLPLTATLLVGLGVIAIRLARRPQPLNNR